MIEGLEIGPDDRVLLLSVSETALALEISGLLKRGLLVGFGEGAALAEGRRATRDCVNVMFQPGLPEEIPWQSGYFTRVIDLERRMHQVEKVAREAARVLAPGGLAYLAGAEVQALRDCGLEELGSAGGLTIFRKPDEKAAEHAIPPLRIVY